MNFKNYRHSPYLIGVIVKMWKDASVREIAVVLAIKLILLYGIWFAFFNHPNERELTHIDVGNLLLGESHRAANPTINSQRNITGVENGF